MAQGDKFQFAIAYPLKNHKFRHPTILTLSVNSNGEDNIIISTDFDDLGYKIGITNDPGEFDSAIITSSDGETSQNVTIRGCVESGAVTILFTLETMTISAFDGGTIKIAATGIAGGWSVPSVGTWQTTGHTAPRTIIPPGGGKNDRYAQYLLTDNVDFTTGIARGSIGQSLDLNKIQDCTIYRIGLNYKFNTKIYDAGSGTSLNVVLERTSTLGEVFKVVSESNPEATEWNEWTDTFLFRKGRSIAEYSTIDPANLYITSFALGGNKVRAWIDNIFLEHAFKIEEPDTVMAAATAGGIWTVTLNRQISELGWTTGDEVIISNYKSGSTGGRKYLYCNRFSIQSTSGKTLNLSPIGTIDSGIMTENAIIHKNTGGYYQPNDYPIRQSIAYDRMPIPRTSLQAGGDVRSWYSGIDSDRAERWVFGCNYVNVAQSIYDAFQNIIRWQERGELVAFHPFIDDLPDVMIGHISLSGYTKANLWDLSTCSFSLEFTEVLL